MNDMYGMNNSVAGASLPGKKRIVVLASGSGSDFASILENLESINGEVVALVSDNPEAYALIRASQAGVEAIAIQARGMSAPSFFIRLEETLFSLAPDLIVAAGFIRILPASLCARYKEKILNIHPALLPSFGGKGFYGIRVHEAVIQSGAKLSGASVHFVTADTDAGPIVAQESVPVHFEDTPETLAERVLETEHRLLPQAVALFCDDRLEVVGGRVRVLGPRLGSEQSEQSE